jgi:hypothetical protein
MWSVSLLMTAAASAALGDHLSLIDVSRTTKAVIAWSLALSALSLKA